MAHTTYYVSTCLLAEFHFVISPPLITRCSGPTIACFSAQLPLLSRQGAAVAYYEFRARSRVYD